MYGDQEDTVTKVCDDPSNAKLNHSRVVCFQTATQELIKQLHDGSFSITVVGKQQPRKSAMAFARGKNTREMLQNDKEILVKTKCLMSGFNMDGRMVDPNKQSVVVELLLSKKHQARLQQKLEGCRKMVDRAQKLGRKSLPISVVRDVINAHNSLAVDKAIGHLEGAPEDIQELKLCQKGSVKHSTACHIL